MSKKFEDSKIILWNQENLDTDNSDEWCYVAVGWGQWCDWTQICTTPKCDVTSETELPVQ